ncbi:MAG TPA: penicillin-binding transpeptidase domain-containing protein, partial [Gammaproteobacteria bacterium]|nr:penicillin-binding transpeptidase domain-containing protein [Gammaproteobacteria bacterium]
ALAILDNNQTITLPLASMTWARALINDNYLGPIPTSPKDLLKVGDVVYVQYTADTWQLSQVPLVSGAFVALNPKDGAISALMGGYDFRLSHFNRATQAYRQPGSNFKPFIYSAAFENGFTPASLINDAPVIFHDPSLEGVWRPQNDTRQFYGPTRLRIGLTHSRNLVSIRLLEAVGINPTIQILKRFGFPEETLQRGLSLALGTPNLKPIDMAAGYGTLANGGFRITPYIIQKVGSRDEVLYEANPATACPDCLTAQEKTDFPALDDANFEQKLFNSTAFSEEASSLEASLHPKRPPAPRVLSPQTAYIMTSLLQDVIQTGTGKHASILGRKDLAGKTGTTNRQMDAWFSGYNQNIVATTWVGFDEPHSLKEYGAQAALPIWINFMGTILKGVPEKPFDQPQDIVTLEIDPETGLLARPGQTNAIFEVFNKNTIPQEMAPEISLTPQVAITPSGKSQTEALF